MKNLLIVIALAVAAVYFHTAPEVAAKPMCFGAGAPMFPTKTSTAECK